MPDASENEPYDLRPYVRKIVDSALQRLAEMEKAGSKEPLFLLLGENHACASHRLIELMVLKELKERNIPLSFGNEWQHDKTFELFCQQNFPHVDEHDLSEICQQSLDDPHGAMALKATLAFCQISYAPLSQKALLRFALKEKLKTSYNDVARDSGDYLQRTDPKTQAAVRSIMPGLEQTKIYGGTPEGLLIRNYFIAQESIAHTRLTGARICVQICGRNHLAGDSLSGKPYQESLSAMLKKAGAAVLAVPLIRTDFNLPDDFNLDDDEWLKGLNPPAGNFDRTCTADEKIFLEKLCAASGLDPAILDVEADCAAYKQEMTTQFEKWIHDFRLGPA